MSRQGSRKNHTLSKEELEVNEACFGPSGSEADKFSEPATPSPGQGGNKILQTGSINQLAEVLAKSLSDHLQSNNILISEKMSTPVPRKRHFDYDLPLPTGKPSDANNTSPIIFGVDVNPPPPGAEDRNGQGSEDPVLDKLSSELSNVKVSDTANADKAPQVTPYDKLPSCSSDTHNWKPDPAVLAWAKFNHRLQ